MKFCSFSVGALLALSALTFPAIAQEATPTPTPTDEAPVRRRSGFRPGVQVGFFKFNSDSTGDTFGGNGVSISPAFGAIRAATKRGNFRPDLNFNFSRSNDNTLIFAPIGARYVLALGEKKNQPYVGLSLNAVPSYTKIETAGLGGKFKVGIGGSAIAGYNFGDRFNIEARYFQISRVRGFDLSHFVISAGVRF